jgi:hypothetical protein
MQLQSLSRQLRSTDFDALDVAVQTEPPPTAAYALADGFDRGWLDAVLAAVAVDPQDIQTKVDRPVSLFVRGRGDKNAIDANDVKQGGLGDCYFVSALAAMALNDPGSIENMIHENRDAAGNVTSYTVDLYSRNAEGKLVKTPQVVDASEFSQQAAAYGDNEGGRSELWVRIVEKAYAQLNGGYSKIGKSGNPESAYEALTGEPGTRYKPSDYSFSHMQQDLADGKPICVMTPTTRAADGTVIDPSLDAAVAGDNLVQSHVYYVTGTKVENGQQMVHLENPWGHTYPGADKDGWIPLEELQKNKTAVEIEVGPPVFLTRLAHSVAEHFGLRG